jgi:hypothetical protein
MRSLLRLGIIGSSSATFAPLLVLSLLAESTRTVGASVNKRCAPIDYYYEFLQTETGPNRWAREDLEDLLRSTHSQVTPIVGSRAGEGDVLEALIEMDGLPQQQSIQLFYSDNLTAPQYPLDRSGWEPENVCPLFMSSVAQNDFDAAYSDLHNIRPVHPLLHESVRGTQYFGICPTCIELFEQGSDTCICGDFFQPPEASRGVVARALLYMQLRYPDIKISNCHLEQLLAWHVEFPPTPKERERNNLICSKWQGNRNPFVDIPELAWSIRVRESSCDEFVHHGDVNGGNDHGYSTKDLLGSLPIFDLIDTGNDLEDGALEFDTEDDDFAGSNNIFARQGDVNPGDVVDLCAELMLGDIFFYVMQASPSRMGFIPLIDLPKGLTLFMSDTLSFASSSSTSMVRIANDFPEIPLLRITLEEDMVKGNPFGYGRNLLLGSDWEVVTDPITVRGKAIGGDELFLFCYDNQDRLQLLSALTTNGSFRDDAATSQFSLEKGFGKVVLPEPMDYYVYNGPHYAGYDPYQKALMDSVNWLGFDLTSPPDYSGGGTSGAVGDIFAKEAIQSSASGETRRRMFGGWTTTTILVVFQCLILIVR